MRFLWLFVVVFCVRCDDNTLGTTTSRAYSEYPIPTLHSHASLNNDDDNTKGSDVDAPLDLFKWKNIETRRKAVDIWAWDLYCHLQPVKGSCKDQIKRYYYDSQMDSCNEFQFTGCDGNKNNFETMIDCERRCKGANYMGVNEKQLPTVCYLQADSGLCLAFMTNYYYDVNSRACVEFTYGGCGGNLNRFETKKDCEDHCNFKMKPTSTTTSTTITKTIAESTVMSTDATF